MVRAEGAHRAKVILDLGSSFGFTRAILECSDAETLDLGFPAALGLEAVVLGVAHGGDQCGVVVGRPGTFLLFIGHRVGLR